MLNYLYKKTNYYRARYQEAEKFINGVPMQLEIGCFGSSYARYDYDFTDFNIRGFNFGIYPQPLYYDLVLLKHYADHFCENAYIILNFPALAFALDLYDRDTVNYKYYKFLNKDEIINYSWKTKFFEIDFPLIKHPGLAKKIWNDDEKIFNKILWSTSVSLDEDTQARKSAYERADDWCKQFGLKNLEEIEIPQNIKLNFDKNIEIINQILRLCEERHFRPALVIPPVSESLSKMISKEFKQKFVYDNLEKIEKGNAVLLDYTSVEEYKDYRLYSNSDFMNSTGRKIFTEHVLYDLFHNKLTSMPKENCVGCSACKQICTQKAVRMVCDTEGFWYPKIDYTKCIRCGRCEKVCSVINQKSEKREEVNSVFAAWSINEELRIESTSGGIFSELALLMLSKGSVIYGACYNDDFMVEHISISRKEDLGKLRQSKYVQSDLKNTFTEITDHIKQNRKILFCGTPCQCEALLNFLEEKDVSRELLVTVDFICRGANSPKVYKKYLAELSEKYHSPVKRVWFKNKTYGWSDFSTKIEFENGQYYLKKRCEDEFVRGYIEQNLFIRPSCMKCYFKGTKRSADITLADFWGVKMENQKNVDKGTSLIMIHSKKGAALFEEIKEKIYYEEKKVQDIIPGNPCMLKSVPPGPNRNQFMMDLDRLGFFENMKRFQ